MWIELTVVGIVFYRWFEASASALDPEAVHNVNELVKTWLRSGGPDRLPR